MFSHFEDRFGQLTKFSQNKKAAQEGIESGGDLRWVARS